jgi:putative tricarboxylic transport membrane protein
MLAKAEIWAGLFWLAIGAYVAWAGRDLGLGTLHEPGSGFALFWIGLLMVALSLLVMAPAAIRPSPGLASLWTGVRWGRVLVVVGLLLVFGFGFERVGFIPGAMALLLVLMLFVDPVGPWKAATVSILAPIAVWFVMTKWLRIQLPAGLTAGWLD